MSDVKLLPLPEWCLDDDRAAYVLEGMSGQSFREALETFARACIEADRKERGDG